VDLLKALGAEVIVCPTAVEPDDPRSYYSVAKKLAKELPNSFYPNQYENAMNPGAHLPDHRPGNPWEDSEGKIHALRLRHGHGWNDQRGGALLERENPDVKIMPLKKYWASGGVAARESSTATTSWSHCGSPTAPWPQSPTAARPR